MKTICEFIKENDFSGPATVKAEDRIKSAIDNWNTEVIDSFDTTFGVVSWSDFEDLRSFAFKLETMKKIINTRLPKVHLPEIKSIKNNPYSVLATVFTGDELYGMSTGEIGYLLRLAKSFI